MLEILNLTLNQLNLDLFTALVQCKPETENFRECAALPLSHNILFMKEHKVTVTTTENSNYCSSTNVVYNNIIGITFKLIFGMIKDR